MWIDGIGLLADTSSGPSPSAFLQYGAIGLLAFLAVGGLVKATQLLIGAYNREKDRADRLEAAIEKNYMGALSEAIEALKDALASVRRG